MMLSPPHPQHGVLPCVGASVVVHDYLFIYLFCLFRKQKHTCFTFSFALIHYQFYDYFVFLLVRGKNRREGLLEAPKTTVCLGCGGSMCP